MKLVIESTDLPQIWDRISRPHKRLLKKWGKVTVTIEEWKENRSVPISTRFHAHLTYLSQAIAMDREELKIRVLLEACAVEADGGDPWPYRIVDGVLHPLQETKRATNKQMITLLFALELFAAEQGVELPERESEWYT